MTLCKLDGWSFCLSIDTVSGSPQDERPFSRSIWWCQRLKLRPYACKACALPCSYGTFFTHDFFCSWIPASDIHGKSKDAVVMLWCFSFILAGYVDKKLLLFTKCSGLPPRETQLASWVHDENCTVFIEKIWLGHLLINIAFCVSSMYIVLSISHRWTFYYFTAYKNIIRKYLFQAWLQYTWITRAFNLCKYSFCINHIW